MDEASVSVGSFYFYFKSKEDLFTELYRNIAKMFSEKTMSVIDAENFPLVKNFTSAIMANLWLYEQNRDIARIMLMEAAAVNPEFQRVRAESMRESAQDMTIWFERFKLHEAVNIPDARVAALIYEGSFYYLIDDWLESDASVHLTDYGYSLCVYNLQAMKIPFEEESVRQYINEVIKELDGPNEDSESKEDKCCE